MFDFGISFDSVWYLSLLALLPLLWWLSFRSLTGLGRVRRIVALTLRSLVLILIIAALAEMQWIRRSDRLTVIYLLDQSLSVPESQRREMVEFVNQSIRDHRDANRRDRFGVIVFGRDAPVEIPPIDDFVEVPSPLDSVVDAEFTDLSGAMEKALAIFPHDAAKRVVIVTDGNQNLGDARQQSRILIERGVSIDVVPIFLRARGEIAVEKITLPSDVRRSQPFELRTVLHNAVDPDESDPADISGTLKITRRAGPHVEVVAEQHVTVPPGKTVLTSLQEIKEPDFYTYEARFVPDDPADDAMPQNNRATTFTHVRGRGHVLLIEDWAHRGDFDYFVDRLRKEDLEVTVQASNQLFSSLAELQRYDTVVLANVPRSSGEDADTISHFSDEQISWLVRNTQQMGSGLVMIGGENAFGAGGWTNTELEKAMPVDFQIKNAKVAPVGALAMIMHAGEMPRGNYWQKVVAREALKALGHQDYCGLVHWGTGGDSWLWGQGKGGMLKVGAHRKGMLSFLDRMTPGDMPQFDPAMKMAHKGLMNVRNAANRHMIIISDGDPSPASRGTLQALAQDKIKVTTVAVGSHGTVGHREMQKIARATGGKYYVVKNARALPRIYQREARRVSRSLVYQDRNGLTPIVVDQHEIIQGLEGQIPPFTGFVLTTIKDNPLVEVPLVSPRPAGVENSIDNRTLLATWTYGLGKVVALTTDAGHRWASDWRAWDGYDKLFGQIVRWSMRPVGDTGRFTVATDVRDGKTRIVVTALDKDDEFLNFLNLSGMVVGPDMQPADVQFRQTAPGRYLAEIDSEAAGSYFVTIMPGAGQAPIRTGVNVAYSDEFRRRETNQALLTEIAAMKPKGGAPGQLAATAEASIDWTALAASMNPFRRDLPRATAGQDAWFLLVLLAACLFFFDVFIRRVHVSFAWLGPWLADLRDKVLRREPVPVEVATMSRLQSRKAEVVAEIAHRRATSRFELADDTDVDEDVLDTTTGGSAAPPARATAAPSRQNLEPDREEDSYTSRLLKAKKKAQKETQRRSRSDKKDEK